MFEIHATFLIHSKSLPSVDAAEKLNTKKNNKKSINTGGNHR